MSTASAIVGNLALFASAISAGWWLLGFRRRQGSWLDSNASERWLVASLTGLLALYGWLWISDVVGLGWSMVTVVSFVAPAFLVGGSHLFARYRARRASSRDRSSTWMLPPSSVLPASALACLAVVVFGVWSVHPDFVYHWGIKGARYFLHQGIDVEYLSQPWNTHLHPDYPQLVPSLMAAGAVLSGAWSVAGALTGSWIFGLLLVLAADALLFRLGCSPAARWLGVGTIAWMVTMLTVGRRLAGGADLPLALALTAGAVLLAGPVRRRDDLSIAVVAAFAACVKIEGVPLALLLVGLHILRRLLHRRQTSLSVGDAVRTVALPLITITAWAARAWHHGWFQSSNAGGFDPARLAIVLPELGRSMLERSWHGLPLLLFLLPILWLIRSYRWPIALCAGQGAFYLWVYCSAPVDTQLWVMTSGSRLLFHLMPTVLAVCVCAIDHASGQGYNDVAPKPVNRRPGATNFWK